MSEWIELGNQVRKIWFAPTQWRRNEDTGNIEFSLPTSDGDSWWPVYRAPQKVEEFVKKWERMGGGR